MVQVDQVSGTGGDEKLLENNIEAELRQDYLTSSNRQDIIILAKDQESCGDRSRSPKQAAMSVMSSIDGSEPPSPTLGPPTNFAQVVPGIYRSSFPKIGNFEFLGSLGLKTVVTLVAEEYPAENKKFITARGIKHIQIPIPANKSAFDSIPPGSMIKALKVLFDRSQHPVLLHCNKGKHRTGCVIGCFRKINDWTIGSVLEEYRRYAGAKARVLDEKYMELFDEHATMIKLDCIRFATTTENIWLITPPSSVKDDAKDESLLLESARPGAASISSISLE